VWALYKGSSVILFSKHLAGVQAMLGVNAPPNAPTASQKALL
jgi:hypothetical protein